MCVCVCVCVCHRTCPVQCPSHSLGWEVATGKHFTTEQHYQEVAVDWLCTKVKRDQTRTEQKWGLFMPRQVIHLRRPELWTRMML